jgi:hypothetical protein
MTAPKGIELLRGKASGGTTSLKATEGRFAVLAHAVLSVDGGGIPGGPPVTEIFSTPTIPGAGAPYPGGPSYAWGGSHGGIGGDSNPGDSTGGRPYPPVSNWGPATDSPLDPKLPGGGGAGSQDPGAAGGGIVEVVAETVKVDGRISANGGEVLDNFASGGAGGTINIRSTGELSGRGMLRASGGDCVYECGAGYRHGAGGGGGRIAVRYAGRSGWKGRAEAFGGVDDSESPGANSGGAGTQFWLKTAKPKAGKSRADPRGGTLIVADRGVELPRPVPFETPVLPAWSSPGRDLVVAGGARVMAARLRFSSITLRDHAAIHSGPVRLPFNDGGPAWVAGKLVSQYCRGFCGADKLVIRAEAIAVDATSRIDVTGRGGVGGAMDPATDDAAPAPRSPGGGPGATQGHGGSHGGLGGKCHKPDYCPGGTAGKVYDSATHPSKPGAGGGALRAIGAGAPGGGVLSLVARTLDLEGRVTADGMGTDGPTFDETNWVWSLGGAGAGGSIAMKVARLSGAGSITASGGGSCLEEDAFYPAPTHNVGHGCSGATSGSGGGGRVAVCVTRAGGTWTGEVLANGGPIARPSPNDAKPGRRGSVVFKHKRC